MVELACELFRLPDGEQMQVWAPICVQQVADIRDEIQGYAYYEAAQIEGETQDAVHQGNVNFDEFVPRYRVLAML